MVRLVRGGVYSWEDGRYGIHRGYISADISIHEVLGAVWKKIETFSRHWCLWASEVMESVIEERSSGVNIVRLFCFDYLWCYI